MIGQTISHYTILSKLGEGGMGVVYKARDTKLDRSVALKFLPESLADSPAELARLMQEARAAASLSHPNICTIYGFETVDGHNFIVMEFVDGQTLREKEGSFSQKQAIHIAIQIAEGLAAAHEHGVVHRDIKPENIIIRKDGNAQIMDFGLAKLRGASRLTKAGSMVGTAGYMSPEHVQGQDTDHRSDIFSFGTLLFEMFTGQLPFKGVHETAIAYEIVNIDSPSMSSVKPDIAPELDAIVSGCLEKEPKERTQSAGQVAVELRRFERSTGRHTTSRITAAVSRNGPQSGISVPPQGPLSSHRKYGKLAVASLLVIVGALGAVLGWMFDAKFRANPAETESRRVNISAVVHSGQQLLRRDVNNIEISPDGSMLVYALIEAGASQLYLRPLNDFRATPIKGTENGIAPFFSPDGQWIGFVADGKLKKVSVSNGVVESICDVFGFRGASWGPDNKIIFSPSYASALSSVSAAGGEIKVFSQLDSAGNERTHRWPQVLPDGKWVLYTIGDPTNPNSYEEARLALQSTETGERHILNVRGEMARYVEPGFLIVARNGTLLAAPFSLKEFRITKPLTMVMHDISGDPGSGISYFSVSRNGHLVFLPGSVNKDLELVWVNRKGTVTAIPLAPQPYNSPRISPDGTRLAVTVGIVPGNDNDIWVYDLRTAAFNRLTFEKRMFGGVWSPDSKQIYFASAQPGNEGLMVKSANGSSSGTLLLPNKDPLYPISVSPGGKQIIVNTLGGPTEGRIQVFDVERGGSLRPLIVSHEYDYGGHVSPDGRFIVCGSNETGSLEVFIHTYPEQKGKWQVSTGGGFNPVWCPDGKELFYVSSVGTLMAVSVQTSPALVLGTPKEMFDVSHMFFPNSPLANYDIAPDGQRFVFVRNANFNANVTAFNAVLDWVNELKRGAAIDR